MGFMVDKKAFLLMLCATKGGYSLPFYALQWISNIKSPFPSLRAAQIINPFS